MRKTIAFIALTAIISCFSMIAGAQEPPAGQKLFLDKKCNTCHSIEALKIKKKMASSKAPDHSTVGETRTAEWLVKWLNKEETVNGKKHTWPWTGTPEEQKVLVDWLASLKKPK